MWDLARQSPTLDLNSPYSYLILCRHFADTCVVADLGGELAGFLTGYLLPQRSDTVFVWQIAVSAVAQRSGLGRSMVTTLLDRVLPRGVRFLEASATPENSASHALFRSVARRHGVRCTESPFFRAEHFPAEGEGAIPHQPELLLRLGPF